MIMIRVKRPVILAAAVGISAIGLALVAFWWSRPPRLTVDFLAVGQGDSELVSWGGEQALIDGGPDRTVLAELGSTMPFFDRTIENVILTHPHADHFTGLLAVFGKYQVKRLFVSDSTAEAPAVAGLLAQARAAGAEIVIVGQGDRIGFGPASFAVLWPLKSDTSPAARTAVKKPAADDQGTNDTSLVLRLTVPVSAAYPEGGAVMFTGDAGVEVEKQLVASGQPLRSAVLKVGHHGSTSATSAAWLDAVRPRQAVIEVGRNNYGHPAYATRRRLTAADVSVWRTDCDGDVRAVFGPSGLAVFSRGLAPAASRTSRCAGP